MKRALVLLALCFPLAAQTAMYQPMSQVVSNSALGKGSDICVWVITVDGVQTGTPCTRSRVLMAAPKVRAIPNAQAEVLMQRKSFRDPRSRWVRVGAIALQLAPLGLAAAGAVTGSPGYSWAGLGTSGLTLALPGLRQLTPDPTLFRISDLLPDVIDRAGQWFVITSKIHDAQDIGPINLGTTIR